MVVTISKLRFFLFCIFSFILWQGIRYLPFIGSLQTVNIDHGPTSSGDITPVSITVFYEALCPDSKHFIIKHLHQTIEKAPRLVSVTLVPYGKAKTEEDSSGNISFTCQHGPVECHANRVHACAIDKIHHTHSQVKYVACMIANNFNPEEIGEKCAKELNIEWEPILRCSTSKEANQLLKTHGERTHALRPRVSFIPTVLLDEGVHSQAAILKNLFKEVCLLFKTLPSECEIFKQDQS